MFCCESRNKQTKSYQIVIDKNSGQLKSNYNDNELPLSKQNEISIQVRASSISQIDQDMIQRPYIYPKFTEKKVLGRDFSGIVKEIGENSKFQKGEYVYGVVNIEDQGCWAQNIVLNEKYVSKMPKILSFEEAASVPYSCLVAYKILSCIKDNEPGTKIVIHDAAIDEGFFAIQIAKLYNFYVYASTKQKDLVEELKKYGANEVGQYWKEEEACKINFKYIIDFTYEIEPEVEFNKLSPTLYLRLYYLDQSKYEKRLKNKEKAIYFNIDTQDFTKEIDSNINTLLINRTIKPKIRQMIRFYDNENPFDQTKQIKGIGKKVFVIDDKPLISSPPKRRTERRSLPENVLSKLAGNRL